MALCRWFFDAVNDETRLNEIGLHNVNLDYAKAAVSAHVASGFLLKGSESMSLTSGIKISHDHYRIRAQGNFYNLLYLGVKHYTGMRELTSDQDLDPAEIQKIYQYHDVSKRILNSLRNERRQSLTEIVGILMNKVSEKKMDPIQATMAGFKACIEVHNGKINFSVFSLLVQKISLSMLDIVLKHRAEADSRKL